MFRNLNKPIKYFNISKLQKQIQETSKEKVILEDEVKKFKKLL